MKKKLIVLAMALMLLISTTAPVAAKRGTGGGVGDGDPPGWSVVPGKGQPGSGN